jgi:hypothetical protein
MKRVNNQFRLRIASCGTERDRGDYSTLKDTSALRICRRALTQLFRAFVEKDSWEAFKYDLICLMLKEYQFENKRGWHTQLRRDVESFDENKDEWTIR